MKGKINFKIHENSCIIDFNGLRLTKFGGKMYYDFFTKWYSENKEKFEVIKMKDIKIKVKEYKVKAKIHQSPEHRKIELIIIINGRVVTKLIDKYFRRRNIELEIKNYIYNFIYQFKNCFHEQYVISLIENLFKRTSFRKNSGHDSLSIYKDLKYSIEVSKIYTNTYFDFKYLKKLDKESKILLKFIFSHRIFLKDEEDRFLNSCKNFNNVIKLYGSINNYIQQL